MEPVVIDIDNGHGAVRKTLTVLVVIILVIAVTALFMAMKYGLPLWPDSGDLFEKIIQPLIPQIP